ncbi:AAA family ATPase [Ramlibacter ginsenosidimutans]|uniref:AAA family ATPase n=1 Tax=Ramlibacter ginsenosidimutans TaxID=502333 RepID=A0A934WPS0_9BURK|nr:AAA family ATPase [Ramlibacter ginsenosidimutans]MBK6008811.1 AAA family ATPase [Ramlibacter ginsenosidimutans]
MTAAQFKARDEVDDEVDRMLGTEAERRRIPDAEEVAEAHRLVGNSIAAAVAEWQTVTPEENARRKLPFEVVRIAGLRHIELPPPLYAWEGLIPIGYVTNLSGHGGTGKTIVSLQLAVSVVLGLPLFGKPTRQGNVGFFSGEDGKALLLFRLQFICGAMGVNADDLDGKLFILDATERDPTLFVEQNAAGQRIGRTTIAYEALRAFCKQQNLSLLVVDNASDVYSASEIDRAKVRAFMRALAQIARECDAAVLLLAHVDKGTSRGERSGNESYSGSTAWHNSARSRLFLRSDAEGTLTLEQQKHNLGTRQLPLRLVWPVGGVPSLDEPLGHPMPHGRSECDAERALLRLIAEYTDRGEFVSTAHTSRTHAAKVLRQEPSYPKWLKDAEVFDLLRKAERAGRLERVTYKGTDRHERERWHVTHAGRSDAATAGTAGSTRSTAHAAEAASPCGDCGDLPPGGMGDTAAAQVAAPGSPR